MRGRECGSVDVSVIVRRRVSNRRRIVVCGSPRPFGLTCTESDNCGFALSAVGHNKAVPSMQRSTRCQMDLLR